MLEHLAIVAASCDVEWKFSLALSSSSSVYVDSWISKVLFFANSIISSHGLVSPEYVIFIPFRASPRTCSGFMIFPFTSTSSPLCNFPKRGPTGTPSSIALFLKNLGFFFSSIEYARLVTLCITSWDLRIYSSVSSIVPLLISINSIGKSNLQ